MTFYSAKNKAIPFYMCLLFGFSFLIACGGASSSSPVTGAPAPGSSSSGDTVSISVVPATASLIASDTQLFNATVSGTTNTAVTWQVNGVTGGNSTLGTITSTGLYTAPAVTSSLSVTVSAISTDDNTKSASAAVTVTPTSPGSPSPVVAVAISPTSASLSAQKTQQFAATVTGTSNTAVSWQVNGVAGGNSSTGTINSSGLYTAPAVSTTTSVTVTAVSAADSTKSASAKVTVSPASSQPISVSVTPTSATVTSGKTQQFTATVSGGSNTAVTWEVDGISGGNSTVGTISSGGLYTAPTVSTTTSITVEAVSVADATKSSSASITVSPASTPPPTSAGSALYVSPSGSDSNDGSASHPFATIQKAANSATPGVTVHVAAGIYQAVTTSKSGTASQRIRFISDVQWGAKLTGSSSSEAVWMQNGSYIDVVGFDISTGSRLGIENNGSYVRILGNYVHNIPGDCSGSGGAGIDNSNYSASNDDIIGNIVGNIGPTNNGSCNTVQGIYLSNSAGTTANNIVFNVAAWGIQMWHAATNATIVNNTVFNCYGGIIVGAGDSPGGVTADNTLVANNIVYKNVAYGIDEYGATGTHNRYLNNLVAGNPTEISLQNGLSATDTVTADPLFTNYQANGTGDYHLNSSSPAINTGTSASAPTADFSGGSRPVGGAWDIGAYEFGASAATWPWY